MNPTINGQLMFLHSKIQLSINCYVLFFIRLSGVRCVISNATVANYFSTASQVRKLIDTTEVAAKDVFSKIIFTASYVLDIK